MTGKEEINRDVDKFKASKRKEMAKKMSHKLSGQELEDHLEHKMLKGMKTKSEGVRNSRRLLD